MIASQPQTATEHDTLFRVLVHDLKEVVFRTDAEGRWTFLNRAWEEITGFDVQESLGRLFLDYVHPDDREANRARFRPLMERCKEYCRHEVRYLRRDGGFCWVEVHARLVLDDAGSITGTCGSIADISAHRSAVEHLESRVRQRTDELERVNAALQESEERYRTLVETCPDAILLTDLDQFITMMNRRGLEQFGLARPADALGTRDADYYAPEAEPAVAEHRRQLLASGSVRGIELTLRRRDGSSFQAEVTSGLVHDRLGEVRSIVHIVRDITARKQLEEQFRQAQKMEAIGRLAGGVAHDFNNLLTVIKGYGELLLKRLAADAANCRKVGHIVKAAERAAALIEQLLAFSRKQMVEPRILDVNAAVMEAEKMLSRLIGEDIEFGTCLDPQAGSVRMDAGQLHQLLMNLAVNARDALEAGGILAIATQDFCLPVDCAPPCAGMPAGRYVRIEVRDNGTGMTEEVRPHIFEPFFTTKAVGKGTGLGLSTVYGIVQQSGGFIELETAPGAGTAFRIYLPGFDANDAAPAPLASSAARTDAGETILVTEDEDAVRAMIAETLRERGYTVLEARHGRQALEVAAECPHSIHLLLTDVVMPQMGGPELWGKLAPAYPDMRLLYITGHTHLGLPPEAPFLKKPFSPDALAFRVRELLATASA